MENEKWYKNRPLMVKVVGAILAVLAVFGIVLPGVTGQSVTDMIFGPQTEQVEVVTVPAE